MSTFKKGDRVVVLKGETDEIERRSILKEGHKGVVTEDSTNEMVRVDWGEEGVSSIFDKYVRLEEPATPPKPVTLSSLRHSGRL